MAKIKYTGIVDTPTDANELDDLTAHLNRVAELHSLGLNQVGVDLGDGITQISFEAEVVI